jgi:hypothetical protein
MRLIVTLISFVAAYYLPAHYRPISYQASRVHAMEKELSNVDKYGNGMEGRMPPLDVTVSQTQKYADKAAAAHRDAIAMDPAHRGTREIERNAERSAAAAAEAREISDRFHASRDPSKADLVAARKGVHEKMIAAHGEATKASKMKDAIVPATRARSVTPPVSGRPRRFVAEEEDMDYFNEPDMEFEQNDDYYGNYSEDYNGDYSEDYN